MAPASCSSESDSVPRGTWKRRILHGSLVPPGGRPGLGATLAEDTELQDGDSNRNRYGADDDRGLPHDHDKTKESYGCNVLGHGVLIVVERRAGSSGSESIAAKVIESS